MRKEREELSETGGTNRETGEKPRERRKTSEKREDKRKIREESKEKREEEFPSPFVGRPREASLGRPTKGRTKDDRSRDLRVLY